VGGYDKLFWVFVVLLVLLLFAETYFLPRWIVGLPQALVIIIFLASVLAFALASGFLEWKFTEVEETPPEELD